VLADGNGGQDYLVGVTKQWLQNKEKFDTLLDRVARLGEHVKAFEVAGFDVGKNGVAPGALGPKFDKHAPKGQLYLVRGTTKKGKRKKAGGRAKKPLLYTGALRQKDVLLWLKAKSAAFKRGWKKVKAALKEVKAEAAEREAVRLRAVADQEAKLAAAEKEDVSGDGKVTKQTYVEPHDADSQPPQAGDKVRAHYVGTLEADGSKFDSSRDRGDPFEFTLGQGQVIGCWDKGFATMRVGERAVLTCDSDEAYGDAGSGAKIPGGATLKFDVELLGFDSAAAKEEL